MLNLLNKSLLLQICSIYSLKTFIDINTCTLEIVRKIMQIYCICGMSLCCYIIANIIVFENDSFSLINSKPISAKLQQHFLILPVLKHWQYTICTSGTIFGLSILTITYSRCYKIVSPAMHNVCNIKINPYIIMTHVIKALYIKCYRKNNTYTFCMF